MKFNKLLLAAAVSASLIGCSDDYLSSVDNPANVGGLNGKLVESGLFGLGRDVDNTETRGYSYVDGLFIWMPSEFNPSIGSIANNSNPKIGLSWTGQHQDPDYSAGPLTQKVYTNYEFELVGWLDQLAEAPDNDECSTSTMDNGAFIAEKGLPVASFDDGNISTYGTPYQYGVNSSPKFPYGGYAKTNHAESSGVLNLAKGIFKTNNASVFEGEYLVYFPYTDKFTKGQILANAPETFDINVDNDKFRTLSDHAFAVARVPHYEGGNSMSTFKARTFSAIAGVKLYNYNSASAPTAVNIKKVVLYSPKGIIYEKDLDASKLVSALKAGSLGEGTNLYYPSANEKTTNAIFASLNNTANNGYAVIAGATTQDDNNAAFVYFPVLPQDVDELKIILIDDQDRICEIDPTTSEFRPNANCVTTINLDSHKDNFKNEYMVVDEESFVSAFNKIKDNGAADNEIKLLKSITLEKVPTYMGNYGRLFFDKNITISSDPSANATLTLASGKELSIMSLNSSAKLTVDVDFTIEGTGCCGDKVAELSIGGTQGYECNVEFTKTVTNYGTLALANVLTKKATITINELVNGYDKTALDKKEKGGGAGTLYFLGDTESNINITTLTNTGVIKAFVGSVDIDMTGAGAPVIEQPYSATPTLTQLPSKRVINATIGTLTNNTAVEGTSMGGSIDIFKGASITVSTNLENGSDAALIRIEGEGMSDTIDGRLDVTGTSSNKGTIDNQGVANFTKSELVNTGLFIDRMFGQMGGKPVNNGTRTDGDTTTKIYAGKTGANNTYSTDLNVAGIYVSQVETDNRMAFVLKDPVVYPSTVIVEILGCDKQFFNLEDYHKTQTLATKDVYVKNTTMFKAYTGTTLTERSFGHCVTVFSGSSLTVKDGLLSTEGNVNVNSGASFLPSASYINGTETTVTIGKSLTNWGTTTHTAVKLTVTDFLVNYSTFSSKSKLEVGQNLYNIKGTFTSTDTFEVKNLIQVEGGNFTSEGDDNTAQYFAQIQNTSTKTAVSFAANTTTTIAETFSSSGGTFTRLQIGNDPYSRATVNCGTLDVTGGTATAGWPTEIPK